MKSVPIERLKELIRLDADTGRLFWIKDRRTGRGAGRVVASAGSEVGYLDDKGYRVTCVDYVDLPCHRIAFALANGRWPGPGLQVDHINGNRSDNRPCNLREATIQQQRMNKGCHAASGLKGAYAARRGKWTSRIMVNRKNVCLGTFPDAESAHEAYKAAAKRLHGEWART